MATKYAGSPKASPAPRAKAPEPVLETRETVLPKLIAEFTGTYILVLTVGCNVLGGASVWAVTSIAASLMVMIFALGPISGAHLNPAVTLAVVISNKMQSGVKVALQYVLVQLTAGVC